MDIIYCCENYGQNMDHKLVIILEKFDHVRIVANYGQNMVHKMGKIWARFGPNIEHYFVCRLVYSFVGVFVTNKGHRIL